MQKSVGVGRKVLVTSGLTRLLQQPKHANYSTNSKSCNSRWFDPKDSQHITTPVALYNTLSKSKVSLKIAKRLSDVPVINWYS